MLESLIDLIQDVINFISNLNIATFSVGLILTLVFGLLIVRWFINKL